jgi:hypothetical protein
MQRLVRGACAPSYSASFHIFRDIDVIDGPRSEGKGKTVRALRLLHLPLQSLLPPHTVLTGRILRIPSGTYTAWFAAKARLHNHPAPKEHLPQCNHLLWHLTSSEYSAPYYESDTDSVKRYILGERDDKFYLLPDIERILQNVVRRGLEIAIASNHDDKDELDYFSSYW